MQDSPSLFSEIPGETVADPGVAGSGFLRSRLARGLVLGAALLAGTSALTLALVSRGSHCGCASRRAAQARIVARAQTSQVDLERQMLLQRDEQLSAALRDYQRELQGGRGTEAGLLTLHLEQLRVREQLIGCQRARAHIREEMGQIEQRLQTLSAPQPEAPPSAKPNKVTPVKARARHR